MMNTHIQTDMPRLFQHLEELGCLNKNEVCGTADGFRAAKKSMADILVRRDIFCLPGDSGAQLECRLFFDDWYLYAVPCGPDFTYSLFKMREQEYDAKMGLHADGDTPGVTISFIAMETDLLLECLGDPGEASRKRLGREINRVVADSGQLHSDALKKYFIRTEAQGAYLVAMLYTEYIASLSENGSMPVPERYASDYKKRGFRGRVARVVEENNHAAGVTVCDHERIYIRDPGCPSEHERLAILATHAGNQSFFSFAAEVQFHALFLTRWARLPIPIIGRSPYASAIRADLSIADAEFAGPTPYYRSNSPLVKKQFACHRERVRAALSLPADSSRHQNA